MIVSLSYDSRPVDEICQRIKWIGLVNRLIVISPGTGKTDFGAVTPEAGDADLEFASISSMFRLQRDHLQARPPSGTTTLTYERKTLTGN
jgi:hypothetical protein